MLPFTTIPSPNNNASDDENDEASEDEDSSLPPSTPTFADLKRSLSQARLRDLMDMKKVGEVGKKMVWRSPPNSLRAEEKRQGLKKETGMKMKGKDKEEEKSEREPKDGGGGVGMEKMMEGEGNDDKETHKDGGTKRKKPIGGDGGWADHEYTYEFDDAASSDEAHDEKGFLAGSSEGETTEAEIEFYRNKGGTGMAKGLTMSSASAPGGGGSRGATGGGGGSGSGKGSATGKEPEGGGTGTGGEKKLRRRRRRKPRDLETLLLHCARGGIRSFILAFSIRSSFNFVLLLSRLLFPKRRHPSSSHALKPRLTLLRRFQKISMLFIKATILSESSLRFAGALGGFTFLYKWTLHGLRLFVGDGKGHGRIMKKSGDGDDTGKSEADLTLSLDKRKKVRRSKSGAVKDKKTQTGRGQELWWHAAVAGAVGGLAVLAEERGRRIGYAQQLFVRGLQGIFNIAQSRGLVYVPNGDVLMFGFACGQIMYSWMMRPEVLPPGYGRWITGTAKAPATALPFNLHAHREGKWTLEDGYNALNHKKITPRNYLLTKEMINKAEQFGDFGPPFAPCAVVHSGQNTCIQSNATRWPAVFWSMLPVYGALHFLPPLVLRFQHFKRDPTSLLRRSLFGTIRSCSFLATFVVIFQSLLCCQRNFYNWLVKIRSKTGMEIGGMEARELVPKWIVSRYFYWLTGFATCLSLFFEEKKRRGELAMYVLPKALESLWNILRAKAYMPFVPGGEVLLTSAGLSMIMTAYRHDPGKISGLVRNLLWQFVGAN